MVAAFDYLYIGFEILIVRENALYPFRNMLFGRGRGEGRGHELANKVLVGEFQGSISHTILFETQTTIPHRYLPR